MQKTRFFEVKSSRFRDEQGTDGKCVIVLENRLSSRTRGFESHTLRHEAPIFRGFFDK